MFVIVISFLFYFENWSIIGKDMDKRIVPRFYGLQCSSDNYFLLARNLWSMFNSIEVRSLLSTFLTFDCITCSKQIFCYFYTVY